MLERSCRALCLGLTVVVKPMLIFASIRFCFPVLSLCILRPWGGVGRMERCYWPSPTDVFVKILSLHPILLYSFEIPVHFCSTRSRRRHFRHFIVEIEMVAKEITL